jgi:hypothetical protein
MKSATLFKLRDVQPNKERDPFYIKIGAGDTGVYLNFYGEKLYGTVTTKDVIRWLADGQLVFTESDFVFPVKVVTYTWEEIYNQKGLYAAVTGSMADCGYDLFVPSSGVVFAHNKLSHTLSTPVIDWRDCTFTKKEIHSIEVKF